MTDPLGQSQVIPYLKGLSVLGHQISILSCEKKNRFLKENLEISKILNESNITWFPIFYTASPPVLSTLFDIYSLRKKARKICNIQSIEVIHCRSYISSLVGRSLQKELKTKFVFDMRGFWADERVDGKIWNLSNPLFRLIYSFFKVKEKEFLLNANQVISLTTNAKNEIKSWKGFENVPINVIPCCADLDFFSKDNVNKKQVEDLKNKLGISSENFVLSYLGSLGTWYMLDEMLDFFFHLKTEIPKAKFLFITADNPQIIIDAANKKKIATLDIIIVKAKRNQVPIYCSLSDISIFFIIPKYSKKASSPTKMGELMSLGIPIICNSNVGDVELILNDGGVGAIVHKFDRNEYLEVIKKIPSLIQQPKKINSLLAHKYYSLKEGIISYNNVYQSIAIHDGMDDGELL
jgi:glycosyltransferase involved in cell wall biosynthesis